MIIIVRLILKIIIMKKLLLLLTTALFVSCSSEDHITVKDSTAQNSLSVLDGKVLSFKDERSFVREYSDLANLSKDELQSWVAGKKLVSLLSVPNDLSDMEEDVLSDSRVIYSDALKSILNSESKVKIDGKVLWLNERSFYLLSQNEINKSSNELLNIKDELEVYGQLLSVSGAAKSLTSRNVLPNENRIKTFATSEMNVSGSRLRHVVDLYNETIVLNDQIKTSKMYLRTMLQYRSCSTFKCTWKEAFNVRTVSTNLYCSVCSNVVVAPWSLVSTNINAYEISGTKTYLLANWTLNQVLANPYPSFAVSGPVNCQVAGSTVSFDLSWY